MVEGGAKSVKTIVVFNSASPPAIANFSTPTPSISSFAPPTRQASFARNDDGQIINFSDADFAASAFTAPPPRRGRGQPRKNPLPTVAEPTDSSATPPAEGGGEGQSPDAAAETGQENIQVNFIEEQGDWVMVLRQKSKPKPPKTTFPHWNREIRGNFKAWGDPYKYISTDQNFPVPVVALLPAVAPPALPPPFVPPPIILPPPPVNVVPPPAFVPQQPQGPRFGGVPAFHNPFAVLQQQYDDDDDNDDTLYKNLDETVVQQQPQPSGTKLKPPFPAPRTTLSKTLSPSSLEGNRLQSGFHTADE